MTALVERIADQFAAVTENMRREVETFMGVFVTDVRNRLAKELHEVELLKRDLQLAKLEFEKESASRLALLRHGMDGAPGPAGPAGPQGDRAGRRFDGRHDPRNPPPHPRRRPRERHGLPQRQAESEAEGLRPPEPPRAQSTSSRR